MQQERADLEQAKEQQSQLIDGQKDELRQLQVDVDRQKVYALSAYRLFFFHTSNGRQLMERCLVSDLYGSVA